MEEIKITKERILEAASKCSTAKETLKTLFPEVFEDNKYFDLSVFRRFIFTKEKALKAGFKDNEFMEIRQNGEYAHKAFFLSANYNWEIKKDSDQVLCLIPTK